MNCFKNTSDDNKVDDLTGFPKELYDNMKCVELWKAENEQLQIESCFWHLKYQCNSIL